MPVEIITEENPQIPEIACILKELKLPFENISISLVLNGNIWNGSWQIKSGDTVLPATLKLFRGSGSSVDYLVRKDGEVVLGLESTKTSDKDSRNTSVNQRFTKFLVFHHQYPNAKMVLYYNNKQNHTTDTAKLGLRILKTQGVHVTDSTGRDLLFTISSFTTVDEIMKAKNDIKEQKGNISIKISKDSDHKYGITARLSKGTGTTINNDPNIGCVTGLCATIYSLDPSAEFVIRNHGVKLEDLKTSNKFWYANSAWSTRLDGCDKDSKGCKGPENIYREGTMSEAHSTILFETLLLSKTSMKVLFHNHASSAKSSFLLPDNSTAQVPKDTYPDIVFLHTEIKTIFMVEGKVVKDIKKGDAQLDNLDKFEKFVLSKYPEYTIKKGLCIYKDTKKPLPTTKYPVWFTLDFDGEYLMKF